MQTTGLFRARRSADYESRYKELYTVKEATTTNGLGITLSTCFDQS